MNKPDLWLVDDVNDFLFYKCPECQNTIKEKEKFLQHAIEIHPYTSRNLFSMNPNESIADEENEENSIENDSETAQEYFDSVVEDEPQFIPKSVLHNIAKSLHNLGENSHNEAENLHGVAENSHYAAKNSHNLAENSNNPGHPWNMIKNELFEDEVTNENIVTRRETKVGNEKLVESPNHAYNQFVDDMSKEKSSAYCKFMEQTARLKSNIHNYKHHLLQDHEYTKFDIDFSVTCEKCLRTFTNASSLELHRNSHRRCELCGKKFSGQKSKDKFERHVKKHLRVKKVRKHKKTDKCVKDSTGQRRYKSIVVTNY